MVFLSSVIQHISHITRQAQYNHPCYTSCYLYTTSDRAKPTPIIPGPNHTQFTPHSALVPANPYLLEEIPAWLLIYVDGKPKFNGTKHCMDHLILYMCVRVIFYL